MSYLSLPSFTYIYLDKFTFLFIFQAIQKFTTPSTDLHK